jgi:ribose transport system substrate-binding protein
MIKKTSIHLLAIGLGILVAAGCGQNSGSASGTSGTTGAAGTTGTTAAGGSDKPVQVAFVTNNASDFWTIARKGTEKAVQEMPGVQVDFRLPTEGTAAAQKQIIDDLLAKGVQGIAISPVDPANEIDLLNQTAKKALVLTQDSDAPGSDRACYIGTDNIAAGRQAGEEIKKTLPNGGKVMAFVGRIDAQNAKERYQGIQEALKGSNIQVLDVRTDNEDRVRAKSNVSDTFIKHPDVACLVGLWSYNGPAILNATREAGKVGKVKIVCFDEEDETLAGVRDGSISSTIVQQPFEFGYRSVKVMAQVLRGDKSVIPESKQMIVPTLVISKENVDEFAKKLNGLRGRS